MRGLGIFELHRDDILDSYQGGGRWLIPSGSDGDTLYEVRVGTRPSATGASASASSITGIAPTW